MANDILTFAPTDTGTNLLTQAEYAADSDRTNGNQPGVARSKLVNKAIRQSAYMSSQIAQFIADTTGTNVSDETTLSTIKLLAQINSSLKILPPILTKFIANGTLNRSYVFFITSGNATIGATYSHNSFVYTISATIAGLTLVTVTGTGVPLVSGTLTKTGGTGDASLTFHAFRQALALRVRLVGGGGGGAGSGNVSTMGAGGNGGSTTFGGTLLSATGGSGAGQNAQAGGGGGSATINSPATGTGTSGTQGGAGGQSGNTATTVQTSGGAGGSTPLGAGAQGTGGGAGNGPTGFGSGGAGGGSNQANIFIGAGGGSGGFIDALITTLSATYAVAIGAIGAIGTAGTNGFQGSAGSAGYCEVYEQFQ